MIKYRVVFLNKTITSFRLNYAVFKKKINPIEAANWKNNCEEAFDS